MILILIWFVLIISFTIGLIMYLCFLPILGKEIYKDGEFIIFIIVRPLFVVFSFVFGSVFWDFLFDISNVTHNAGSYGPDKLIFIEIMNSYYVSNLGSVPTSLDLNYPPGTVTGIKLGSIQSGVYETKFGHFHIKASRTIAGNIWKDHRTELENMYPKGETSTEWHENWAGMLFKLRQKGAQHIYKSQLGNNNDMFGIIEKAAERAGTDCTSTKAGLTMRLIHEMANYTRR